MGPPLRKLMGTFRFESCDITAKASALKAALRLCNPKYRESVSVGFDTSNAYYFDSGAEKLLDWAMF